MILSLLRVLENPETLNPKPHKYGPLGDSPVNAWLANALRHGGIPVPRRAAGLGFRVRV